MEAGTSTVTFTVTDLQRVEGAGRLAALAAIEIELDGIALMVHGIRVVRHNNRIATEAPRYRNPKTGQWLPALILPEELGLAIAREVHRMLGAPARPRPFKATSLPSVGVSPADP
jgi:stage V sporulation protein G